MYQSNYNGIYAQPVAPIQQQQPIAPRIAPILKGRPVTSIEEVRATSVDFDGSVSYFPDLANNKIYTKQINIDGTAKILMYEPTEIPQPVMSNTNDFVTHDEFNAAIQQLQKNIAESQPTQADVPAKKNLETGPTAFNF